MYLDGQRTNPTYFDCPLNNSKSYVGYILPLLALLSLITLGLKNILFCSVNWMTQAVSMGDEGLFEILSKNSFVCPSKLIISMDSVTVDWAWTFHEFSHRVCKYFVFKVIPEEATVAFHAPFFKDSQMKEDLEHVEFNFGTLRFRKMEPPLQFVLLL